MRGAINGKFDKSIIDRWIFSEVCIQTIPSYADHRLEQSRSIWISHLTAKETDSTLSVLRYVCPWPDSGGAGTVRCWHDSRHARN